jgi:hypothetical protein
MNKYWEQLKKKPYLAIIILLIGFLSYNGIVNYWYQFKEYILVSELKKKGIDLEKEELTILKDKSTIDSTIVEQTKEADDIDYQKYKKEELAKRVTYDKAKRTLAKKGIKATDADIDKLINSDELLSKYRKNN